MPQAAAEQGFLKLSIAVTVAVASAGVVFGLMVTLSTMGKGQGVWFTMPP